MKRLTALLAALAIPLFAAAQDAGDEEQPEVRRYTVEIVVFTYTEDVSVGTEVFPPDEPRAIDEERLLEELKNSAKAAASESPVRGGANEYDPDLEPVQMRKEEFTLQRVISQFELLDAYETVMHFGWTQATLPGNESQTIELTRFGTPPSGLAGNFRLYLSRYLHLVVDLALDDGPGSVDDMQQFDRPSFSFGDARLRYGDNPALFDGRVRYRIQENRIMKNGDIRYFDHPKFGVIAKVTRVEEAEEEEDGAAAEQLFGRRR